MAFLGTQAPLLAIALYLLLGSSAGLGEVLRALALLAAGTLAGMAVTLLALRALLAPIGLATAALEAYLEDRTRPRLPRVSATRRAGSWPACGAPSSTWTRP